MGWGIDAKVDLYLSRQDYQENPVLVQDKIDELEENINIIKTKINMYASANPKDLVPDDWNEEPIRWINNEVDELIDWLHECIVHRYQLELYKEYLEEKQSKND